MAAKMPFSEPEAYPFEKPALALLFADTREERFTKALDRLEPALGGCGYNVMRFNARDVVSDVRRVLTSHGAFLGRLLVVYDGHGCIIDGHPKGLLCGESREAKDFVRVAELEAIADSALPSGVPKVFFLDCCFSESKSAGPPKWHVHPGHAHIHDVAFLRSSSEGMYGYGGRDGSGMLKFVADSLERFDKLDLDQLKHSITAPMASFAGGIVEPMLNLGTRKLFTFVRGQAISPLPFLWGGDNSARPYDPTNVFNGYEAGVNGEHEIFALKSVSSGRYLDGRGGEEPAIMTARPITKDDTFLQWTIQLMPDGTSALQSVSSNRYLDGRGGEDDAILTDRAPAGDKFLNWIMEPMGGKTFALKSASSGRYLDGRGGEEQVVMTARPPAGDFFLHWLLIRVKLYCGYCHSLYAIGYGEGCEH